MAEHDEEIERQRRPIPPPGELDPDLIDVLYKGSILKKLEKNGETRRYYREYKPSEQ
jgi:hypothetical protein